MLSWFRRRLRWISTAALVSLITLLAWSSEPHPNDGHDADFGFVLHDENGHAVERPRPPSGQPLHCVLCHWTQLVRPSVTAVASFSPSLASTLRVRVAVVGELQQFQTERPSLRGPPASPVVA